MKSIAVIGAGSWGLTIANLLAVKGHKVSLWARDRVVAGWIEALRITQNT